MARKRGVTIGELRARRLDVSHALRAMPWKESGSYAHEQRSPLPVTTLNTTMYRASCVWDAEDNTNTDEEDEDVIMTRGKNSTNHG